MDADVIVVGAGLSGLVTAYRLQRSGLSVRVLEATARAGGVIGSERRDGVLCELGPNSAMDTSPAINALLDELGIRDQRVDASATASRRYVVGGGRLVPLPNSLASFIGTPLFSTSAKLRLFAEPFIRRAPSGGEESVAQFVCRRLGREFLDYAVEPFVSGIYAGDPEQLSLPAAFPRLHELEQRHGSLFVGALRSALGRRRATVQSKARATSFSFRDGMQTLTDALAAPLQIDRGASVTYLERQYDGSWLVAADAGARAARSVVLAVPAYAAAPTVRKFAPEAAEALAAIPYAPIAIVVSAYRRADVAHPLDGFGFLAPAVERPRILGSLFSSTMFAHRAEAGTTVFTSFLGGRRDPDRASASDPELLEAVQRELARLAGVSGQPLIHRITRWPFAIPQYTFGHRGRIAVLEQAERDWPGLFFCANYRGGVAISDCLGRGTEVAHAVARQLGVAERAGA
jgi:oxygen-dependent protoporphyrinogen oxidase